MNREVHVRFWESAGLQCLAPLDYIKGYERMPESRSGLSSYFAFYNYVSYCPTSLCAWKLNAVLVGSWSCGGPRTAAHLLHNLPGCFRCERLLRKHPRPIRERMQRRDRTALHGTAQCLWGDPQKRCGFGQIHPSIGHPPLRRVTRNLMRAA